MIFPFQVIIYSPFNIIFFIIQGYITSAIEAVFLNNIRMNHFIIIMDG
jgi:hypothetical protein